jgi:DNA mismatch endonuclease (patch repair protein)
MGPETRSAVMSRIRGKNTGPERVVAGMLRTLGLQPDVHVHDLPGRPDFAFRDLRIAIFVDGDFWHGWRFPAWRLKLSEKWDRKIEDNRIRDARNHARLRRAGWKVLRIWEHQVFENPRRVEARLATLLTCRRGRPR